MGPDSMAQLVKEFCGEPEHLCQAQGMKGAPVSLVPSPCPAFFTSPPPPALQGFESAASEYYAPINVLINALQTWTCPQYFQNEGRGPCGISNNQTEQKASSSFHLWYRKLEQGKQSTGSPTVPGRCGSALSATAQVPAADGMRVERLACPAPQSLEASLLLWQVKGLLCVSAGGCPLPWDPGKCPPALRESCHPGSLPEP